MSHIHIRNLSVSYGKFPVLRNVTLEIPDAQIVAIIGPSGCGKTTLLKSMNRLLDLQEDVLVEGEVLIDGLNIYGNGADVLALRKKVGFLSQRPYPLPMSIYDNIAFGMRIHGLNGRRATGGMEARPEPGLPETGAGAPGSPGRRGGMDGLVEFYLQQAGLWDEVKDRLHTPAASLSIGQQQRLALARALAVEPEVILADEPTSALDPISVQVVERQFRHLKNEYTIIVVTHILRQARRIADYVAFLYMGELVEHGPATQFFNSPVDERTRAYINGTIS